MPWPLCRVAQVSLVCKLWREVEQRYPHQPRQLILQPEDLHPDSLTWHLTATGALEEVSMPFGRRTRGSTAIPRASYLEGLHLLLHRLSTPGQVLQSPIAVDMTQW